MDDFPEEYKLLKDGHDVITHSYLATLAPKYDPVTELIRVGGRLRKSKNLDFEAVSSCTRPQESCYQTPGC